MFSLHLGVLEALHSKTCLVDDAHVALSDGKGCCHRLPLNAICLPSDA